MVSFKREAILSRNSPLEANLNGKMMSRVQLQLDNEILARAERLAAHRGITLDQLFAELVQQAGKPAEHTEDPTLGLFSDEPELVEQVLEDILRSREETLLRTPHG